MVELYINEKKVDLFTPPIVAYNYELYATILSAFTASYTSTIDLPLTATNKGVFNMPTLVYGSFNDYSYHLYVNGASFDEGVLVINGVTDAAVNVTLYSKIIQVAKKLESITNFGECLGSTADKCYYDDGAWVDSEVQFPTSMFSSIASKVVPGNSDYCFESPEDSSRTEGFVNLHFADVAKSTTLDCATQYNGTSASAFSDGQERMFFELKDATAGVNAIGQIRTIDLQPVIPCYTLFANMFRYATNSLGTTMTMSSGVKDLLHRYSITLPTFRDYNASLPDDVNFIKPTSKTTTSSVVTVSAPNGVLSIKNILSDVMGPLGKKGWAMVAEPTFVDYFITGTYMDIDYDDSEQVHHSIHCYFYQGDNGKLITYAKKCDSRPWDNNMHLIKVVGGQVSDSDLEFEGLPDYYTTYTITSHSWIYRVRTKFGAHVSHALYADGVGYANMITLPMYVGGSVVNPTYNFHPIGGLYSDSVTNSYNFLLADYLSVIQKPWELITDLCKNFNLRFTTPTTNSLQLILPSEYYDTNNIVYLRDKLDYTGMSVNPYPFDAKKIVYDVDFNGDSWSYFYRNKFDEEYGTVKKSTNYPIEANSEWFEFKVLKRLSTLLEHTTYRGSDVNTISRVSQAFDKDDKQIAIPYSLCVSYIPGRLFTYRFWIADDMPGNDDAKCYYTNSFLSTLHGQGKAYVIPISGISTLSGVDSLHEVCLPGPGKASPSNIIIDNNIDTYFKDVIDQTNSVKVVMGVFINKLHIPINTFIRKVFYFENSLWIVSKVSSFDVNSASPAVVEFIKINDIANYA